MESSVLFNKSKQTESEAVKKVGDKVSYFPYRVLGTGLQTRVCEGLLEEKRPVAVKRLEIQDFEYFTREIEILCSAGADSHPNIIRYFCSEVQDEFRFIVLELCDATLEDWVQETEKTIKFGNLDNYDLLRQSAEGLAFLHSNHIIHRDIKPSNILLQKHNKKVIVKISDFGLSRRLPEAKISFTASGRSSGTEGWKAPEVINAKPGERLSSKIDVWAFGCVIYYTLTGFHPFERIQHFPPNKLDIFNLLQEIPGDIRGTTNLVMMLTFEDPNERPPISYLLRHPIFWDEDKIMRFFQEVRVLFNRDEPPVQEAVNYLESIAGLIFPLECGWKNCLGVRLLNELASARKEGIKVKYNGNSVVDLIKALRNKYVHFEELGQRAQMEIGGKPKYLKYWLEIFPNLLTYTYLTFSTLRHLDNLRDGGFYPKRDDFKDPGEEIKWNRNVSHILFAAKRGAGIRNQARNEEEYCKSIVHDLNQVDRLFSESK